MTPSNWETCQMEPDRLNPELLYLNGVFHPIFAYIYNSFQTNLDIYFSIVRHTLAAPLIN